MSSSLRSDGTMRLMPRLAWLSLCVGVVACSPNHTDYDALYPEGACVTFSGTVDEWVIEPAECSGPHTHVVVARSAGDLTCPSIDDIKLLLPGTTYTTWCLGLDP